MYTTLECHQYVLTLFAEQIKKLRQSSNVEHDISIFWVPRRTLVSDSILEEAGITGDVNIADLPIYFLPLEQDVLSLELDSSFGDLYLVSLSLCRDVASELTASSTKTQAVYFCLPKA